MRALLQIAQKERSEVGGDPLYVLTAPCVIRSPKGSAALYDAELSGALLQWAPSAARGSSFTVAGRGDAVRLAVDGFSAVSDLRGLADSLLGAIIEMRQAECDTAPRPRLYGGFRFEVGLDGVQVDRAKSNRESMNDADPWQAFADASFALPRWSVLERGSQGFLQLAIYASELLDLSQVETELRAIEWALADESPSKETQPAAAIVKRQDLSCAEYCAMIEAAVAEIHAGAFLKVVPARRSSLQADRPFDAPKILGSLKDSYLECNRFALERQDAIFLGATPELLITRSGQKVHTEALAGTRARTTDSDDEQLKRSLLLDDKERREHAHVVSAIVDSLRGYLVHEPTVDATGLRSLRNVHHLCTQIEGELRGDVHVLDLVAALHPTPAVCGLPRQPAARFLTEHEPQSRGLYAAPVGWFDAQGDGMFCVAIRSALIRKHRAWLYAGAGVVAGSDPQKEYHETSAKLRAMLGVLGAL